MSERLDWERARFVDWPADRADAYRAAGIWAGQTLFDAVAETASEVANMSRDRRGRSGRHGLVDRAEQWRGLRALGLAQQRGSRATSQHDRLRADRSGLLRVGGDR
jgi:non-ribosomal peptide synthetase component E (peptide arylation enzyme)